MRRALWWAPPLLWTAVILAGSSDSFSAGETGGTFRALLEAVFGRLPQETFDIVHFAMRKATHLVVYAVLGALTYQAARAGRAGRPLSWALAALGWSLLIAIVDETHQSTIASRTGTIGDVLIDFMGASVAVLAMRNRRHPKVSP